jgi:hypothetical protein
MSETFSSVNSLLSGINTGIFREFVLRLSGFNGLISLNTGGLSHASFRRWLHKTGGSLRAELKWTDPSAASRIPDLELGNYLDLKAPWYQWRRDGKAQTV